MAVLCRLELRSDEDEYRIVLGVLSERDNIFVFDVVAASEEEALEKAKAMVECGELDLATMELGDCGYEPMGEVTDKD